MPRRMKNKLIQVTLSNGKFVIFALILQLNVECLNTQAVQAKNKLSPTSSVIFCKIYFMQVSAAVALVWDTT